jgi:mono/diheme cytochrome c family protein
MLRGNAIGRAASLLSLLLLQASPSFAQDATAGKVLAERWCSSCHLVEAGQRKAPNDAIPSFIAIAQMPSTTRMSLNAFLVSPHPPMPNLILSRSEIANVSVYILSLKKSH